MQISGFAAGPYKTNCYLLAHEGRAVVIDPGMHTHDRVVDFLAQDSLSLDKIVLTHGHIDHTRDAGQLARRFNVPVHLHAADHFMLESGGVSEKAAVLFDMAGMTPIPDLRELVPGENLDLVGESFAVSHAPGHSPGSVLLHTDQLCFSGDVLFQGAIGRTDLMGSDPDAMITSLRTRVLTLADQVRVLPGHGGLTTMRAERAENPFLKGLTPA
ncbi:MBL fold metallo-hydrolase [Corynebacterium halotolerans]|uniref:MBL fold metallo-hydrolase n=1 Tax=Corynebacterium halotolerans TaxID=225326 RepID=UPI003CE6C25D